MLINKGDTPTLSDPSKDSVEHQVARQIVRDHGALTKAFGSVDNLITEIKGLTEKAGLAEATEVKGVLEKLDSRIAVIEEFKDDIRSGRWGIGVPGLGDTKEKFSLGRALHATGVAKNFDKAAWENAGAGFEHEVIRASHEAVKAKSGFNTTVGNVGGIFVPMQVLPGLIPALYEMSPFLAVPGAGGQDAFTTLPPLYGKEVSMQRAFGGAMVMYQDEDEEAIETLSRMGDKTMRPRKATALWSLTEEMMDFGAEGFEALILEDLAMAFSEKFTEVCLYGNGGKQPLGIFNYKKNTYFSPDRSDTDFHKIGVNQFYAETGRGGPLEPTPSPGAGGELEFDALDEMRGVVEDQKIPIRDSWRYAFPPRYRRRVSKLKVASYDGQTTEKAYLLGAPMISKDRLASIIGPFIETVALKTDRTWGGNAHFGDVFAGNMRAGLHGVWDGLQIMDDEGKGTGFAAGRRKLRLRMYHDFLLREEREFVTCTDARMRDA